MMQQWHHMETDGAYFDWMDGAKTYTQLYTKYNIINPYYRKSMGGCTPGKICYKNSLVKYGLTYLLNYIKSKFELLTLQHGCEKAYDYGKMIRTIPVRKYYGYL